MKFMRLTAFLLLLAFTATAQLSDDFSDGDFSANPAWQGETSLFTVNASNELQSNGPSASDELHLSTPNTQFSNTEWQFLAKLGFNPSSSNNARVYLMSDQSNLEGSLNGYYVSIGASSDRLELVRQTGTSRTAIISSISSFLNTSSVTVRVSVIRDDSGNWNLKVDDTGGTNFTQIGTATDNTHQSTSFFGVFCDHTSTRRDLFTFDDIEIKNAPISLVNATVQSSSPSEVQVLFSEAVDAASAQQITNYQLSGLGNPVSATVDGSNPALIQLTFASPLTTGNYTLTVNNVQDVAMANTITANSSTQFSFVAPIGSNQIIINEIFADPSPIIGLPDAEFIELLNLTSQPINLLNATFTDGSSTATFPNYTLPANGYLIICSTSDTTAFKPFGATLGFSSFPSLNNTGELLEFKDALGNTISAVSYETAWYRDDIKDDGGYSLEVINPTSCALPINNWSASNDASGGTPGTQNSIFDNTAGTGSANLVDISILNASQIQLNFDRVMDASSLTNALYAISGGVTVNSVVVPSIPTSVTLNVSGVVSNQQYTVTVTNATDCGGANLTSNTANFAIGIMPTFHELIITEILANNSVAIGLPQVEYIEIYNRSTNYIDLSTVNLSDASKTVALPAYVIAPQSYLTLAATDDALLFNSTANAIGVDGFPSLTNDGEQLSLTRTDGTFLFEITYSIDWYGDKNKAEGGFSLEMIDTVFPCIEQANWTASNNSLGGTPGQVNSVIANLSDNQPAQLLTAFGIDATHIQLIFDEKLDSTTALNASYTITNGITVNAIQFDYLQSNLLTLETSTMNTRTEYTISVTDLEDCPGNLLTSAETATFGIPESADSLDIILNEVTPEAFSGGQRFVELYNNSDKYINLQGWEIARQDEEGFFDSRVTLTDDVLVIAPNSYYAFTGSSLQTKSDYPNDVNGSFSRIIQATGTIPSFGYEEDNQTVVLFDNLRKEQDRFVIQQEYQFELIADTKGVSLERVSFDAPTNDGNNWKSAASTAGFGTPGYLNSQNLNNPKGRLGSDCFEITPEVFSPDNDGTDDFTTIHYTCGQNDLSATIIIYDAYGREVKRLVQNQLLATEGFIQWDGTTDGGEKAKVGYYIVLIEAFKLDGTSEKIKKTVAVGARF